MTGIPQGICASSTRVTGVLGVRDSGTSFASPGGGSTQLMILWRLYGISSDFVCSIEKARGGYRLVVRAAAGTVVDDVLPDIRRARWKADMIRSELLEMGYRPPV
jgi:hypothetical protein